MVNEQDPRHENTEEHASWAQTQPLPMMPPNPSDPRAGQYLGDWPCAQQQGASPYGQGPYPHAGYGHPPYGPYGDPYASYYGAQPAKRSRNPLIVAAAILAAAGLGVSPLVYNAFHDATTTSSQGSTREGTGQNGTDQNGTGQNDGNGSGGMDGDGTTGGGLPGQPNQGWPGGGGGGQGSPDSQGSQGSQGQWAPGQDTQSSTGVKAPASLSKGVVLINTATSGGEGAGTGMILTSDGEVLTSYHVVNGSSQVKVTVASSNKTYTTTVVGHDQAKDIALLKLQGASGLTPVTIDKDKVNTGTSITAVGNASGQGYLTQVKGTVTALNQSITASSEEGLPSSQLTGLIETNARVVPGDSGGPLFDAQGEVMGVNAAASASNSTASRTGAPSDSYAVPIGTALAVVDQIRSGNASGTVIIGQKAFLGVSMASSGDRTSAGATIAGVTAGGAAAKAGLVAGDVITAIDGTAISNASALSNTIATHHPGDSVKVTWRTTSGATRTATITLGKAPIN